MTTAVITDFIDITSAGTLIPALIDSLNAHGTAVRSISIGNKVRFYRSG